MEMRMEIKGKEKEGYVGYVLCTYTVREREMEMCSQVTAVHRICYLGQVGRYLPTTMEWQIHTLGRRTCRSGQLSSDV